MTTADEEFDKWLARNPRFDPEYADWRGAFRGGWNCAVAAALAEVRGMPRWGSLQPDQNGGFDLFDGANEPAEVRERIAELAFDTQTASI